MGTNDLSKYFTGRTAAGSLLACLAAGTILLTAALALAQEGAKDNAPPPAEQPGFFGGIMGWFDRQASGLGSNLKGAGSQVENFGHEAGVAAKTTVDGAKEAAGAVVKIPAARVVTGHERCALAPNGAPDCLAAANAMCKTKGFDTGKSVDMTTAEICPAQVYLSGRNSGEGCHAETFVSRALCQ
jgi:hypothetical protein